MKKYYESPEAEIEKFTIVTVFTDSTNSGGGGLGDGDTEEPLPDF